MALSNLETDILVQDAAISAFRAGVAPLSSFAKKIDLTPVAGDKAGHGGTVKVPFYSAGTVKDFSQSTGYVSEAGAVAGLDVPIDKRKYVNFDVGSKEFQDMPVLQRERMAQVSAEALATAVMVDIYGIILAAAYTNTEAIGAAGAYDYAGQVAIEVAADALEMPNPRSLHLPSGYIGNLEIDLKGANVVGDTAALREGSVGKIASFDTFKVNNIPANGESLIGIAAEMDGLLVAMRPVVPPDIAKNTIEMEVLTDPDSEIVLVYRRWFDPNADAERSILECTYGRLAGNPAGLIRLTVA